MTSQCIHGFPASQCASCRDCPHGLVVTRCPRCRAAATSRKASATSVIHAPEEYAGYEIFYEAAVTGWRYRAADASASVLSYRSRFLARRAVDEEIAAGGAAPPPSSRKAKAAGARAAKA